MHSWKEPAEVYQLASTNAGFLLIVSSSSFLSSLCDFRIHLTEFSPERLVVFETIA